MDKYFRKVQIVDAFQWFPGVDVKGVSISSVFEGTAMLGEEYLNPGDWCVYESDGFGHVYTDEEFHKLYDEVFPGYKGQS